MLSQTTKDRIKYALANADAGEELSTAIDVVLAESGTTGKLDFISNISALATADASDLSTLVALTNDLKLKFNDLLLGTSLRDRNSPWSTRFLTSEWETEDGYDWISDAVTPSFLSSGNLKLLMPASGYAYILPNAIREFNNGYCDVAAFYTSTFGDATEFDFYVGAIHIPSSTGYVAQVRTSPAYSGGALALSAIFPATLIEQTIMAVAPKGVRIRVEPDGSDATCNLYTSSEDPDGPNWVLQSSNTIDSGDLIAQDLQPIILIRVNAGTPSATDYITVHSFRAEQVS